jgi:hypothetical protein
MTAGQCTIPRIVLALDNLFVGLFSHNYGILPTRETFKPASEVTGRRTYLTILELADHTYALLPAELSLGMTITCAEACGGLDWLVLVWAGLC